MRIELAKLILVGTRITYQATGDVGEEKKRKGKGNTGKGCKGEGKGTDTWARV